MIYFICLLSSHPLWTPPGSELRKVLWYTYFYFIWYVRGMWLYGTLKMRLFANENQDLGKISPTFFSSQIILMWKLRMSCSSCRNTERTIKSCKAIRVRCVLRGCQPLTHDSEGIIDDIIMHAIWLHLCKNNNNNNKTHAKKMLLEM